MKAAMRLEIYKKDEIEFMEKVTKYIKSNTEQELITYYRTQLHRVFKMGLNANKTTTIEED